MGMYTARVARDGVWRTVERTESKEVDMIKKLGCEASCMVKSML